MADLSMFRVGVTAVGIVWLANGVAFAATYNVVAHVPVDPKTSDGIEDVLTVDPVGRLVGTVSDTSGGDVFALIPKGGEGLRFTYHTLFSFGPYSKIQLSNPLGGVTLSNDGLVGPLTNGGAGCLGSGCGGIFRLDNPATPTLTVLHSFDGIHTDPPDGSRPASGLAQGPGHYLYGTTIATGRDSATAYAISGSATTPGYQIIYRFNRPGVTGPTRGRFAVDPKGRLFGALETDGGGVYTLQHAADEWKEHTLYLFRFGESSTKLDAPVANVVLDSSGNIYGCAQLGAYGQGGIFKLAPPSVPGGVWSLSALYAFGAAPLDPIATATQPNGIGDEGCGITIDPATNIIYGTSFGGGAYDYGTIFSLAPPQPGQTQWTETIIHSFTNSYFDGAYPVAPPLKVGNTYYGGTTTGSVYAFTP